jgi:hypothetical protein
LRFPDLLRMVRDALLRHGGSGHAMYLELEQAGHAPVDESNFYRKLGRMPVNVSRAFLRECTMRLSPLMAGPAVTLDACFDGFTVIAGDGKKIKDAAKRLKPTRGFTGSLLGAKALVAMDVRCGLALAMSDSLDGEANDVPLVPELMQQLRDSLDGPILSVWDRQFGDAGTLNLLAERSDAYLVRLRKGLTFQAESTVEHPGDEGRCVRDQTGMLFGGSQSMRVRQITLVRGEDEEDVCLVTNLLDATQTPADALLQLYRMRWGIEQVFQQVTETFSLDHLIGCAPKAILFQFSVCLLMYNLIQLIKTYVASDGAVAIKTVSTHHLFADVKKELTAWAYHAGVDPELWPRHGRDAEQMRERLQRLLAGSWCGTYTKASDKKPRPKRPPKTPIPGGHTSVQRLLEKHRSHP